MTRSRQAVIFGVVLCVATLPDPAALDSLWGDLGLRRYAGLRADPSFQISVGFRQLASSGHPMPVQIFFQGDSVDREIHVSIRGTPSVRADVELPRSTGKHLFFYTEPETDLTVGGYPILELRMDDRVVHSEPLLSRFSNQHLVPAVGGPGLQFDRVDSPPISAADLPIRSRGYSGLSGLMIYPQAWSSISPAALEALTIWVEDGGVLVVPTVSNSQKLILSGTHPFAHGDVGVVSSRRGLFAVLSDEFHNRKRRTSRKPPEKWDVVSLTDPPAGSSRLWPANPKLPTILSTASFGRGSVFFFCFDPAGIPRVGEWADRRLFETTLVFSKEFPVFTRRDSKVVSAEARHAVRGQIPTLVTALWFFAFLLLYVFLITPGDYWLVRYFGRPRLTWVTFPVTVLCFSGAAWLLGQGRVGSLRQQEVTWVDTTRSGSPMALAHSVIGVYSDTNQSFTFRPIPENAEILPLNLQSGGAVTYFVRPQSENLQQKMHIWADHEYYVRWQCEAPLVSAEVIRTAPSSNDPSTVDLVSVRVDGELPRTPHAWVVSIDGDVYEFVNDDAISLDGGGWKFLFDPVRRFLPSSTWDAIGGERTRLLVASEADQIFRDRGNIKPRASWVAAILPEPWPALELMGRRPRLSGVLIVRCMITTDPLEDVDAEIDRAEDVDPVLDER